MSSLTFTQAALRVINKRRELGTNLIHSFLRSRTLRSAVHNRASAKKVEQLALPRGRQAEPRRDFFEIRYKGGEDGWVAQSIELPVRRHCLDS